MPLARALAATAVLLLAGCSVGVSTGEDARRRVRGRVLDAAGRPYAGATVEVGGPLRSADGDALEPAGRTTTGADGRFRLDAAGARFSSVVRVTAADGRTVTVPVAGRRRLDLPDLRLWDPAVSVTRAGGTRVRLSWAPAPYGAASYGLRLPRDDYPREVAAPAREAVVDVLRDGPGRFVLLADATVGGREPFTVRLEAPVADAALDLSPVPLRGCTGVDAEGLATALPGCAGSPAAGTNDGGPSFVVAELARPVSVGAVHVRGCDFFCNLYVSGDGRRWREVPAKDDGPRLSGDEAGRVLHPDEAVTTRWVGVASRLGPPFDGDTAADVARGERGMPFRGLAVYAGRPPAGDRPERVAYRQPPTVELGAEPSRAPEPAAAPVDREDPLPASALSVMLLLGAGAGVVVFLAQGRPSRGARR